MSYKPQVQVAGNGDKWMGNALRFATREEAQANADNLMARWIMVTGTSVAPSDDPVNYRWTDDGLVPIAPVVLPADDQS